MNSMVIAPRFDEIEKHPDDALTGYSYFTPTESVMKELVDELFLHNWRRIVVGPCSGSPSQNWNVSANAQNGSFTVRVASTGLCMNVRGGSTAQGAVMEVATCSGGSASTLMP